MRNVVLANNCKNRKSSRNAKFLCGIGALSVLILGNARFCWIVSTTYFFLQSNDKKMFFLKVSMMDKKFDPFFTLLRDKRVKSQVLSHS